ncbi:MAG: hypothetical protein AAFY59_04980, partial [Pseudomonadota bacterium]
IGRFQDGANERDLPVTLGGRPIGSGRTFSSLEEAQREGWAFKVTALTEEYGLDIYLEDRPEADIWAIIRKSGTIEIQKTREGLKAQAQDSILAFLPAR